MKKLTQKGFAAVESLLIVIIVLLVGFIGYYVYHTNQNSKDTLDQANSSTASSSASKKEASTPQQYLTIKEWGVKLPLTNSTKDAYYVFLRNDNSSAYLSLHSLENTQCAADQTSIGAVFRYLPGDRDPESQELYSSIYSDGVKVGNYYYRYSSPQAGCSDDTSIQAKASDARQQLMTSIQNIKAD